MAASTNPADHTSATLSGTASRHRATPCEHSWLLQVRSLVTWPPWSTQGDRPCGRPPRATAGSTRLSAQREVVRDLLAAGPRLQVPAREHLLEQPFVLAVTERGTGGVAQEGPHRLGPLLGRVAACTRAAGQLVGGGGSGAAASRTICRSTVGAAAWSESGSVSPSSCYTKWRSAPKGPEAGVPERRAAPRWGLAGRLPAAAAVVGGNAPRRRGVRSPHSNSCQLRTLSTHLAQPTQRGNGLRRASVFTAAPPTDQATGRRLPAP